MFSFLLVSTVLCFFGLIGYGISCYEESLNKKHFAHLNRNAHLYETVYHEFGPVEFVRITSLLIN